MELAGRVKWIRTIVLSAFVCATTPSHGAAQLSDAEEQRAAEREREAEEAFRQGTTLVQEGRFVQGRTQLLRSLRLVPRPATAYNLALAYRGLGHVLEGRSLVDGLIAGHYGALAAEGIESARALRRELVAMLGTLSLTNTMTRPIRVSIDGHRQLRIEGGEHARRQMDPGSHVLVVSATDFLTRERRVRIASGRRLELRLSLNPQRRRRLWWASLGVVALVGASVGLGLFLARREAPRTQDEVFGAFEVPSS